ncbi:MAG TPA: LamG domain-containing protein, partial [Armatimonadota bacterium]|nr:LamG domain-containing protein [Armatimonadota bacterium]
MNPCTVAALGLLLLLPTVALGQDGPLRVVTPTECMPRADDYGHMWWMHGLRERSPEGKRLRAFETGRYAVALDVDQPGIAQFGAGNGALGALPGADLGLAITVDGRLYTCVGTGASDEPIPTSARLIEHGRFLNRSDIVGLRFADDEGRELPCDARFETTSWPDRLAMSLEVAPRHETITSGPSFGRVGNGHAFDGTNRLDFDASPELEPEQLTLSAWVFMPDEEGVAEQRAWMICKNGNEWVEGNYGFQMARRQLCAYLNIGGGRENVHLVRGPHGIITTEAWHHVAMTYDGSELRLFIDGRQHAAKEIGLPRTPGDGALCFGHRQDGQQDRFRGVLDEVRLYSSALSAEELQALHKAPGNPIAESLAREWSFDRPGDAAIERPGEPWRNARATIALESADGSFSGESADGEAWPIGESRAASVVLWDAQADLPNVKATDIVSGDECPVEHDALHGWHRIDLDSLTPQGEHNDAIERVRLDLANSEDAEVPLRLVFAKTQKGLGNIRGLSQVTGLSVMLRDADGFPTGIPVQISKDWHGTGNVWLNAATMLRLPARSQLQLELTLCYGHWGGVAAASQSQLSLIGWGGNQQWDEAALGAWGESICFEPDQGQVGGSVLDTRPLMVSAMGATPNRQWGWTHNVGGADFLVYYDESGEKQWNSRMKTMRRRTCPVLTETEYSGQSPDGKIDLKFTTSLHRTDDITRGVYRLRYDINEPTRFSRLVLFQCGGDDYSYTGERKFARGNEDGLIEEWETSWGGGEYKTQPVEVTGRAAWFSMHEAVRRQEDEGAWANRGIVIREWDARLGGKPARPWAAERGAKVRASDTSLIDIVPPPNVTELQPGDYVEATIEHIVVPQRADDYYGPNENLRAALGEWENTWRMIHREAIGNDLEVGVTVGELTRRRPTLIRADSDRAEFTVTGGLGYVPVTIGGLSGFRDPVLEMQVGGEWQVVDQSVHGSDFWQADYDPESES